MSSPSLDEIPALDEIRRRLEGREPHRVTGPEAERHASVAAVLRQREVEPEVLLIRRAEHPDDPWSGHMAFPGGRHDAEDRNLLDTAMRETLEEVGLDLGRHGRVIGRLDDVPAIARGRRTGLVIAPFVFDVGTYDPVLVPNYEVAEALWAPLGPLVRGEAATSFDYPHSAGSVSLPAFDVDGRVVWGLTYKMLQLLFEALRAG